MTSSILSDMSSPPGTVCCVLCRGVVAYRGGDATRFNNHMNYEHGAYFDIDFLLAACLMNNEERDAVRNVMSDKMKMVPEPVEQQHPIPPLFIKEPSSFVSPFSRKSDTKPTLKMSTPNKRKVIELGSKEVVANNITIKEEKKPEEELNQKIQFECGECEKVFSTRKSFQNHQSRKGHGSKRRRLESPSSSFVKQEDPIDKDILDKVATLDELSNESSSESSNWRSLISNASAEDAIKTLIGLGGEEEYDEDADDPMEEGSDCDPQDTSEKEIINEEVDFSASAYFKGNPHTLGKLTDKGYSLDQFSTVDNNLPEGWKVKETTNILRNGRKDTKREYLSKDKRVLKTGLAVLEFMRITENFTAKEIIAVAQHISVPFAKVEKYILSL